MKKKLSLSLLFIMFIMVFSLSAESFTKKNQLLSVQVATFAGAEDSLPAFGFGWEKFMTPNMSLGVDLISFMGMAYVPSADMALYLHLKPQGLHLFAGAGGSMIITYEGGIYPEAFAGLRFDLTHKFSVFTKVKFFLSEGIISRGFVYLGVSLKI